MNGHTILLELGGTPGASALGRSRDRGRRYQQQVWVDTEPDANVGRRAVRQGRGSLTEFFDDVTYGVDLGDQFRE